MAPALISTTTTPKSRPYNPSTPHARQALLHLAQTRSAHKVRSASRTLLRTTTRRRSLNPANIYSDGVVEYSSAVRPDSARGILRRLAKITARGNINDGKVKILKQRTDASEAAKENQDEAQLDEEEDRELLSSRPRFTIDVDDSLDGDINGMPDVTRLDEEDSELLIAPTPSILPIDNDDETRQTTRKRKKLGDGDGNNVTLTFKAIDFANAEGYIAGSRAPGNEKVDRRKSRVSFFDQERATGNDEDAEDDDNTNTILTERGRKAISEDPSHLYTGRLSRYSFESIRMSGFGSELEIQRESDGIGSVNARSRFQAQPIEDEPRFFTEDDDNEVVIGGETEKLAGLQLPESDGSADEMFQLPGGDGEMFHLPAAEEDQVVAFRNAQLRQTPKRLLSTSDQRSPQPEITSPTRPNRRLTLLESIISNSQNLRRRRKRLKLTKHNIAVPCLPTSLIKRVAMQTQLDLNRKRPAFGKDHVAALEQATEWFFEQIGEDLAAFAEHGRKKRVDASDALLLIKRQRCFDKAEEGNELRRLARKWCEKDVAKEIDDLMNDEGV